MAKVTLWAQAPAHPVGPSRRAAVERLSVRQLIRTRKHGLPLLDLRPSEETAPHLDRESSSLPVSYVDALELLDIGRSTRIGSVSITAG